MEKLLASPDFSGSHHRKACAVGSMERIEEANAKSNALDMPTSIWSLDCKKVAEPTNQRKSK